MEKKNISRSQTRQLLFQILYASWVDESIPYDQLYDHFCCEYSGNIDKVYVQEIYSGLQNKKIFIQDLITRAAPKFPVAGVPLTHRIIIAIAVYEMFFLQCDTIPEKVSFNEAVELAKRFSDEKGKSFVNGVLRFMYEHKKEII